MNRARKLFLLRMLQLAARENLWKTTTPSWGQLVYVACQYGGDDVKPADFEQLRSMTVGELFNESAL